MAKTLYLLRHAKAANGTAMMQDFERPLAESGVADARDYGVWLKKQEAQPFILYSSALRTQQTLEAMDGDWATAREESLYLATAGDMLHEIQSLEKRDGCGDVALILGHNPGLHELVRVLSGTAEEGPREKVEWDFPTCACAVLQFDVDDWADITPGGGHLADAWVAG